MWNWDWGWLIVFAGTAGVISAVVTQVFGFVGWWYSGFQKRRYLALRLAVIMEKFVDDCSEAVSDVIAHEESKGNIGNAHGAIPPFPDLPDDPDAWLALQPDLANRCLSFSNDILFSRKTIAFEYDNLLSPGDFAPISFKIGCLRHGVDAAKLAKDLRSRNRLPTYRLQNDPVEWMATSLHEYEMEELAEERKRARSLPPESQEA